MCVGPATRPVGVGVGGGLEWAGWGRRGAVRGGEGADGAEGKAGRSAAGGAGVGWWVGRGGAPYTPCIPVPHAHHAHHVPHARQVRAKVIEGRDCFQDHTCYEDIPAATIMFDQGNTSDFGHGVASGHFKLWTAEDLGANPNGLESACPISLRTFTSSGFIAIYQAPLPPSPAPPHPEHPASVVLPAGWTHGGQGDEANDLEESKQ